jgi:hypothetical protein
MRLKGGCIDFSSCGCPVSDSPGIPLGKLGSRENEDEEEMRKRMGHWLELTFGSRIIHSVNVVSFLAPSRE